MLRTRIIPCLSLDGRKLVKTIQFKNPNYLGDPINAVKIFNTKEVDELIFIDIRASLKNTPPNFDLIKDIATECFMPFGYGGGIKTVDQAVTLIRSGVEKIIINTKCADYDFITKLSEKIGSQGIVVSIDTHKNKFGKHRAFLKSGTLNIGNPEDVAFKAQLAGAGEIFVNSIDHDGMMMGYDLKIIRKISRKVKVPVIACGGAGSVTHMKEVIRAGATAVAAGSLFVYHGRQKGILINYPTGIKIDA